MVRPWNVQLYVPVVLMHCTHVRTRVKVRQKLVVQHQLQAADPHGGDLFGTAAMSLPVIVHVVHRC